MFLRKSINDNQQIIDFIFIMEGEVDFLLDINDLVSIIVGKKTWSFPMNSLLLPMTKGFMFFFCVAILMW